MKEAYRQVYLKEAGSALAFLLWWQTKQYGEEECKVGLEHQTDPNLDEGR